jgi:peptidoglycan/LPS O-acetylase OafA/YrhL
MTKARNSSLDSLRGLAILLVIGVHINFFAPQGGIVALAETFWRRVGYVGVDLFFVLSGYLIGSLLLTEMERHSSLNITRFLIRRGFKLYPVYYFFIAYTIIMASAKAYIQGGSAHGVLVAQLKDFLPSIAFIQNYIPPNPATHTWSLAVEEHFYLLLPFMLVFLGVERIWKYLIPICLSTIPICLILRGVAIVRHGRLQLAESHLHFDALMVGVALAVLALKYPKRFISLGRYPKALIALGLVLWLVALSPYRWEFFMGTFGYTLRICGSAMLLLAACVSTSTSDTRRGVLAWIGINSYAIYVWHVTIMGTSEKFILRFVAPLISNEGLRWITMVLVVTVSVVLAGAAVTLLIERPSLALRDKWFPSRGTATIVPASVSRTTSGAQDVSTGAAEFASQGMKKSTFA